MTEQDTNKLVESLNQRLSLFEEGQKTIALDIAHIKGVLDEVQVALSQKPPSPKPVPGPLPTPPAGNRELARELQQYCRDTLPQLDSVLEIAKRKGQYVTSLQKIIASMNEHAKAAEVALASRSGLFLRQQIESLRTKVTVIVQSLQSETKTAAIPFPDTSEHTRKAMGIETKPAATARTRTAGVPVSEHKTPVSEHKTKETVAAGHQRGKLAAGAKAS